MCCFPQGATNTVPADEIRESPTGRAHKASHGKQIVSCGDAKEAAPANVSG